MSRFLSALVTMIVAAPSTVRVSAFTLRLPTIQRVSFSSTSLSSSSSEDQSPLLLPTSPGLITRRDAWTTAAVSASAVATSSGLILPSTASASAEKPLPKVPTVKLGNGSLEVTRTIQGQWQLAGGHGRYRESEALENMNAHFEAGITTLDTADIYGPSELIVGKFVKSQPQAIPCTKFCCFRYLDEIDRAQVRLRIQKVRRESVSEKRNELNET